MAKRGKEGRCRLLSLGGGVSNSVIPNITDRLDWEFSQSVYKRRSGSQIFNFLFMYLMEGPLPRKNLS